MRKKAFKNYNPDDDEAFDNYLRAIGESINYLNK